MTNWLDWVLRWTETILPWENNSYIQTFYCTCAIIREHTHSQQVKEKKVTRFKGWTRRTAQLWQRFINRYLHQSCFPNADSPGNRPKSCVKKIFTILQGSRIGVVGLKTGHNDIIIHNMNQRGSGKPTSIFYIELETNDNN